MKYECGKAKCSTENIQVLEHLVKYLLESFKGGTTRRREPFCLLMQAPDSPWIAKSMAAGLYRSA